MSEKIVHRGETLQHVATKESTNSASGLPDGGQGEKTYYSEARGATVTIDPKSGDIKPA